MMFRKKATSWKILGMLFCAGLLGISGCSRQFWRQQANRDAIQIIQEKTTDPRWELNDYRFEAKRESRFYLPYDKDAPPMPQDDPTSNFLMRCVYGKKGWKGWTKNGILTSVENPQWEQSLPRDEKGNVLLNRRNAIQIALTHSREYQSALENIYFSALSVSLQRFAFDTQFGYGVDLTYRNTLHGSSTIGLVPMDAQLSRNLATGGNFVAGIANSIVWTLGGGDSTGVSTTLVNMSLMQPLLRYGGRAYALENLTSAERTLVMNVRQMERYRQGFYVDIIAGSSGISSPGSGSGSTSGAVSSSTIPEAGSTPSGAGSLYGLIYTQLQLANQRRNVADLRESMERMEALYQAGRLERTQVDQTRQSLLNSQITLLENENRYQNTLDDYKMQLGLPPRMNVVIADPMLESFVLLSPEITQMRDEVSNHQHALREATPHADVILEMKKMLNRTIRYCKNIDNDLLALKEIYPRRIASLKRLALRQEFQDGSVDPMAADPEVFITRVKEIGTDYVAFKKRMNELIQILEQEVPNDADTKQEERLDLWMDQLGSLLLEMSLIQARIRLDSVMLVPVEMNELEALQIARENRLDWMNARAALVDRWRQIEITANALKSDLTFTVDGEVNLDQRDGLSDFLQLGLQFDAPLTRRSERNAYVSALIRYDQTRRNFIEYEDSVHKNIRTLLRQVELAKLNFELKRISVLVAMSRVDQANLQLLRPPKPNETSQFGDSFARDLIEALNALLTAQNAFISDWIDFEAYRMGIDIALGTFRLDSDGMWIDSAQ